VPPALRVFAPTAVKEARLSHQSQLHFPNPTSPLAEHNIKLLVQGSQHSAQRLEERQERQSLVSEFSLLSESNSVEEIFIEADSHLHQSDPPSIGNSTSGTLSGMLCSEGVSTLGVQNFHSIEQAAPAVQERRNYVQQTTSEPSAHQEIAHPAARHIHFGTQQVLEALCEHTGSSEPARTFACKLVQAAVEKAEKTPANPLPSPFGKVNSFKEAAGSMNIESSAGLPIGVFDWLDEQLEQSGKDIQIRDCHT